MTGSSHSVLRSGRRRAAFAALAVLSATSAAHAQSLPTDAKETCTVTAAQFKSWFTSGSVTLNGVVNPANSVTFSNATNNCIFYQWAKQMFLWLTSPAPVTYGGGGGRIMDSPTFYDVSPPDFSNNGQRTFIPHTPGFIRFLGVRAAQVGPNGLPVIFDTAGRMLEVQPTPADATPVVRSSTGARIEIGSVRLGTDQKAVLLDKQGGVIEPLHLPIERPQAASTPNAPLTVQRFIINGIPIFINPAGNVVDVEQGEADGGVLQSQGKSLVYYATMVNDVYAYFLTGVKDGKINPSGAPFPTAQAQLNQIMSFAAGAAPPNKKTFPDPDALAVEVNSAWVEAAGLPNLSSYITMNATIPTYDTSNPSKWTVNGQKTVQLALVGIHVVGSLNGHPEMVWSTFEHFGNAPSGSYTYITTSNATKGVAPNPPGAGTWLFSKANSSGPFNRELMTQPFQSTDIVANAAFGNKIAPSDTMRWHAFGAASNVPPNPLALDPNTHQPSTAASNSDIISINQSISAMMPSGDLRNNYFMLGATWTEGGASPSEPFPSGNEVGTSVLANTTMETYQQGSSNTNASAANCFSCHTSNTTFVSHVFPALKPLF
jgi:hypothetical protein